MRNDYPVVRVGLPRKKEVGSLISSNWLTMYTATDSGMNPICIALATAYSPLCLHTVKTTHFVNAIIFVVEVVAE
jgi:hypothetical protein